MRKGWILLVAVLLALGAASYAAARLVAQGGATACAAPPGLAMLQDHLQLTPAQRRAVAEVDARFAAARPALRDDALQARDQLLEVLHDPNSTAEDARAAVRRFGEAQQAMQMNTIEYTFELRRYLTPEQREKMVNTMGRGICALTYGPGSGRGWGGQGKGPCGSGALAPAPAGGPRGGR